MLPVNGLAILALVAAGGGAYLFVRGFRLLARKRLLLNTPTSKIRSAAMGLVELSGLAAGPYTIPAPITGKSCFLYKTTAWQRKQSGKNREWVKVAEENLHVPFYLDDNTGKVLVNPLGAELDLHRDFREQFSASLFSPVETLPPQVSEFLARNGVAHRDVIRIEECAIKPKNALFIVGTLDQNPGYTVQPLFPASHEELDPRSAATQSLALTQSSAPAPEIVRLSEASAPITLAEMSQQAKIAAALTKAGIHKPEAWAAAGIAGAATGVQRVQEVAIHEQRPAENLNHSGEFDLRPPTVLMKGQNNSTFLISWRSQQAVIRALAWKSAAMIWGGGGLVLLGLYMLLAQMALV